MIGAATTKATENARQWIERRFDAASPEPPFSFIYGGKASGELLKTWELQRDEKKIDEQRTQHILRYTDRGTRLEVRCEAIKYSEYPAVDWVVYFQNVGDEDTAILENIQALDSRFISEQPGEFIIHHSQGGYHHIDAFSPLQEALRPNQSLILDSDSSHPYLPFFNAAWHGGGIIGGIGWTGAWRAEFLQDTGDSISVKASMRESHLLLHPGERIRIPRILVMLWSDDRILGHNQWRRLLLDHYSPRPGGERLRVPTGAGNESHTEEQNIAIINWHVDNDFPIEYHWMDIGWERPPTEQEESEYLSNVVVNEERIPNGIRVISEEAHKHGIKYLLWFGGGRLYPELDRVKKYRPDLLSEEYTGVDNGNPMINEWMIEYYSKLVAEWGIDIFRQDARSELPPDTADNRVGINSSRACEGFYEFWDELLCRSPNLIIDNCWGGGRNIDLETIQRSVPLWRSDFQCAGEGNLDESFDPIGMQGQTYGLSLWVPLSGSCNRIVTPYAFRSSYGPGMQLAWTPMAIPSAPWPPGKDEFEYELAHTLLREYLSVRHCFDGDYYPLTPYDLSDDTWMAWQFDRPDLGEGIVQGFRRPECSTPEARFHLRGLEPDARYELKDFDVPVITAFTGCDLIKEGVTINIPDQPGAAVVRYTKIQ
ncbi:MAG: alpha-galactosidase [Candidatus Poribacteria bacterium]|nr:alpha-galactosidase [Candidatus Poribacteria bacterium]